MNKKEQVLSAIHDALDLLDNFLPEERVELAEEIIDRIKNRFGVIDPSGIPVPIYGVVMPMPPNIGPAAYAMYMEELQQTEFDLTIVWVPHRKIPTIKLIREHFPYSLSEINYKICNLPWKILVDASDEETSGLKQKLEALGCEVVKE